MAATWNSTGIAWQHCRSKKKALRAVQYYGEAFASSRDYISQAAGEAAQACFAGLRFPAVEA
jgi:hypothetical protein